MPGLKVCLVSLTHETKYASSTMKFVNLFGIGGLQTPKTLLATGLQFYKHNTTSSCTILLIYGHYSNVPFKRLALLGPAAIVDHFAGSGARRCVLYFKIKMAGNMNR